MAQLSMGMRSLQNAESALAKPAEYAAPSGVDAEIGALRARLARLEAHKEAEAAKEAEMRATPLNALEGIVEAKRKQIERNSYSKSIPLARLYDQEKLAMMEPILAALQNIMERLDALERR